MILEDKIIIVTGGAGLLGREFVKKIVEEGGIAIIAEIDEFVAKMTTRELNADLNSQNVEYCAMDITSKSSIQQALKVMSKKHEKIDAIVNNAYPKNKNYGKHFFDVNYEDFVDNVGMNLGGYFLCSQQFAAYFVEQGFGNIINISSIYGVVSPRFEIYEGTTMTTPVEYAAIKSGLIHLTKYMAKYLKGKNIRVNSISLGGLFDNQSVSFLKKYKDYTLNKGMLNPRDITGTLVYLLSNMSEVVNGQNIIVDDGFTL